MNLRQDVTFHNGKPLSPDDDLTFDADYLTAYWSQLPTVYPDLACTGANKIDSYTVQLTCYGLDEQGIEALLASLPIVHPDYFIAKEQALFGTGPFYIDYSGQANGEPIRLLEYPGYYNIPSDEGDSPPVEWTFQLEPEPDPAEQLAEAANKLAGYIDFREEGLIGYDNGPIIRTTGDFLGLAGNGDPNCLICAEIPDGPPQGGDPFNPIQTPTPTPQ